MRITPADAALAEGFAGEMETAVYSTSRAGQAATVSEVRAVPRNIVTPYNVGMFCLSEDDCIAQGISFAAYERGVADAAEAFGMRTDGHITVPDTAAELASLRASRDALVRAAEGVIAHMEGRQPRRGWLRDNDSSRDALSALIAALAAAKEQQS